MIRTLRKKFILTAMGAVTVMMVVMLGFINILNIWSVQTDSRELLYAVVEQQKSVQTAPGGPEMEGTESDGVTPAFPNGNVPPDFGGPPGSVAPAGTAAGSGASDPNRDSREALDEDRRLSAVYFVVYIDSDGAITRVEADKIASLSEEEAQSVAEAVIASGKLSGRYGRFRFTSFETQDAPGRAYLFMDIHNDRDSNVRVALLSLAVGLLCWGLMLLVVIWLSRKAVDPAVKSMERQKQFITDAGHEIKTPLAIIQSNVDAMELMGNESKYSRRIREQVGRLTELTQNLLSLSRLEENDLQIVKGDFDLSALAKETLEMFQEPAAAKQIAIADRIPEGCHVSADRQQLARLMSILADNAVKYCPEGGKITAGLHRDGKHTVLTLSNTCRDQSADPTKLFDRFYRGDAARTQTKGGFGIGLASAMAIAEAHKGTLTAKYEGEEIVFTFRLPTQ